MRQYIALRFVVLVSGFLLVALLRPLVSVAQPRATGEQSAPAITVWRNQGGLLPLQRLDTLKLATCWLAMPSYLALQRT